jgi:hypothetical protein
MQGIAQAILESNGEVIGRLEDLFRNAVDGKDVDTAMKLGAVVARIRKEAYQVEAQAGAVARATVAGMAHASAQKSGEQHEQDALDLLINRLDERLPGIRKKLRGGNAGDRFPSGQDGEGGAG